MSSRLLFGLSGALRLAEHATAAPTNLRRPGAPFANTPALRLIVEDPPTQPPVVYLLSSGVPSLTTSNGAPVALYPDQQMPAGFDGWPTQPHEVIDLNQLVPAGAVNGRPLPVARGWYLPLRQPGQRPLIEVMRAASDATYTHLSIDLASLTAAVTKHRHRQPQPQ